jgi:hypothetical protein
MDRISIARLSSLAIALLLITTTAPAFSRMAGAAGPGGADISIQKVHVTPARQESSTASARFTVAVILENRGYATGTVRLMLADSGGTFLDEPIEVTPNKNRTITCAWTVNGTGKHNATATLSGENATSPLTAEVSCELAYIPVEHPSPWYTIPCAFLFIIVPCVAIWLIIRRMRGGDWLEKRYGTRSDDQPDSEDDAGKKERS